MDTTRFGRSFGVLVPYDSNSRQALYMQEVRYETNALYLQAICSVQAKGTAIRSITCDGRVGLSKLFPDIPVQLCRFHQLQIITRRLTRNPNSTVARELRALALHLKDIGQKDFQTALQAWYSRHGDYLNERSLHPETGKTRYTHQRLRRAYHSLQRNLPYLFSYESHPERGIKKTTNMPEGRFADLKRLLRCHQGMSKENKIRFIKDYFSR